MTEVLGITLESGDHWSTLSNVPARGYFERMQTGWFQWTNVSGIPRDVMLAFRIAAGHSIGSLWRLKAVPVPGDDFDVSGPDIAWSHSAESILNVLRRHGTYGEPYRGWNARILVRTMPEGEGIRVVCRYDRVVPIGDRDNRKDAICTAREAHYLLMPVGEKFAVEWERKKRREIESAIAGARRYITTPAAAIYTMDSVERTLTREGRLLAHALNIPIQ